MPETKTVPKKRRGRPPKSASKTAEAPKLTAEAVIELAKSLDGKTKLELAEALGVAPAKANERPASQTSRGASTRPQVAEVVQPEIVSPPPPSEPKPGVVFKSPYPGFHQVLAPGKKIPMGDGDVERIPPKMAVFENGTFRTEDDEEIALMRKKIDRKRAKGGIVDVIEIEDERVKEAASKPVKSVRSDKIDADTPVDEVVEGYDGLVARAAEAKAYNEARKAGQ